MNFNQKEYESLLLGSLLHDIGKFLIKPRGRSKEHPEKAFNYLASYNDKLQQLGLDVQLINEIVRYHHDKNYEKISDLRTKVLVAIVRESDQGASGERFGEGFQSDAQGYFPLKSIFTNIDLELDKDYTQKIKESQPSEKTYSYPQQELSFDAIFPQEIPLPKESDSLSHIEESYRKMQSNFKIDFDKIMNSIKVNN